VTAVRFYRALMWLGTHWLAKLPFADRWGFNLGHNLDEWALMRMFRYLDRVHRASRFTPVMATTVPPLMQQTFNPQTFSTAQTYTFIR
jgi:hypothetical protein